MNYELNPFNPQFGKRPKQFIGRELIVNDFLQSLNDSNDPGRTTIITGIRGSGKTAILSDVHSSLPSNKFAIIDVTAHDGMLLEILDEFIRSSKGKNWFDKNNSGVQEFRSFRFMLSELLDELKDKNIKTVFLIDEAHNGTTAIREFAVTYQHLLREEYDVALLMAGLPSSVNDVLNNDVLTFLRRARRVELENINIKAVEIAYDQAFSQADRGFVNSALRKAAQATYGYPYLIQLIGFYLCKSGVEKINNKIVEQSLELAKIELYKNVHDMLFQELSVKDRDFLFAMTKDKTVSDFAAIKDRLGVSPGFASKYRARLMVTGMIKAAGHGKISFAPPYMREYLLTK